MRFISDDPAFAVPGEAAGVERAAEVIRSALLDRIDRGGIGPGGRVPPGAMAAAGVQGGVSSGELGYVLGELVAAGALRLEPGRGYFLRSMAALAGASRAGAR